jgi:ATP-binding cassette, subfamily C (CFTR/MRP), member 1
VLKGLSLSIPSQQHIAICGRTGSGKTSLMLCLLQMMDLLEGEISIDGVNISTIPMDDLRSRVSVVPQDPFIMPGTVRFNLDPFGSVAEAVLVRALERVGLWTGIQNRGGLDADMDGGSWSTGQKQLFCLARAVIRKRNILLLDEAASRFVSPFPGNM